MAHRIYIPAFTLGVFGKSIGKFMKVLREIQQASDRQLIFDFSGCRMLNPFLVGGLANLLHHYQSQGYQVATQYGSNNAVRSYLSTVCFHEGCDIEQLKDILLALARKSFIPIIRFPATTAGKGEMIRNQYLQGIGNLLTAQLQLTAAQSTPLKYMLSELSTNIHEHSHAASGVVFAQHYNGPSGKYIDLCICDHGRGMLASYQNNPRFMPADEVEALHFAIEGKSSKDRAEARGFGISTSRNMLVKGLKGSWCIWSGRQAFLETPGSIGIVETPVAYPGTYIALRIPTVVPEAFSFYEYLEK